VAAVAGYNTRSVQARFRKKDPHGSLIMPLYDTVAFEADTAADLEASFRGRRPAHAYSRISNPTVEFFEQKLKDFSGASAVTAVASGMSAIASVLLAIAGSGDNIVTTKHIFGNTFSLLTGVLAQWGLQTIFADLTNVASVEQSVTEKTRAVFLETITNPGLEVADLSALGRLCRRKNILLVADTTLTPPYLLDAPHFGVNIEVLSSTKYISGGGTTLGGAVLDYGSYDWRSNPHLRAAYQKFGPNALSGVLKTKLCRDFGNILSPHNAYMQSLGLDTLAMRAALSCASTLALAKFLQSHPLVRRVNYPGLAEHPACTVAQKQFPRGAGALLTFELETPEKCFSFMDQLKLIRRATNLNDNKTLIIHPASTIFCEYTPARRLEMGVTDTLLRLAVGIEDLADLQEDLQQALEAV
jgi:O-acetylhomoserine (thiol)-lyase